LVSNHVLGRAKRLVATVGLKLDRQIIALWYSVSQHQFHFFLEMEDSVTKMTKRKHMVVD
jgi:hypothetical protein